MYSIQYDSTEQAVACICLAEIFPLANLQTHTHKMQPPRSFTYPYSSFRKLFLWKQRGSEVSKNHNLTCLGAQPVAAQHCQERGRVGAGGEVKGSKGVMAVPWCSAYASLY